MRITILGSGTSQGVPIIACDCHVCKSADPRDKRLRSSILISHEGENYVIDSGPDFRQQMLREQVKTLSGILFTHEHKDHVAGLDDVRAFNFIENRDMQVYCNQNVEKALHREFHYVFVKDKYPGTPSINVNLIDNNPFVLPNGIEVIPIEVMHYRMPVFAFRIKDFTYMTDAKTISDVEFEKLMGTKVLILNCLHEKEHISHLNLEEALALIDRLNPEITYLTHISHQFGTYDEILAKLPAKVFPAYDGLTFEI